MLVRVTFCALIECVEHKTFFRINLLYIVLIGIKTDDECSIALDLC